MSTTDTPVSLKDSIVIDEQVVFRELNGEMVLLNLDTGIYFGLDETGTRMWMLLRERPQLSDVVDAMVAEYDVSRTDLEADLRRLIRELSTNGLAQVRRHTPATTD